MSMTVGCGAASDAGAVRDLNEDSVIFESGVFAVADGMGGHAAGEIASGIAVDTMRGLAHLSDPRPEDVLAAIDKANDEILSFARSHSGHAGMGTTLAGMGQVSFGGSEHWMIFNVGDSRVYRYSSAGMARLSTDHSEVEELMVAGEITEEEARVYPRRNVITRSLGTDPRPVPDTWMIPVELDQRFLVCSDGLILELTEDEVAAVLRSESNAQRAADQLVADAVRAGGRDNVSAVVVDVIAASSSSEGDEVDVTTGPRPDVTRPRSEIVDGAS
jgi:protein phosphatase